MVQNIRTTCPWCEQDPERDASMLITDRELIGALRYAKTNKTPILVSHRDAIDACCWCAVLPEDWVNMEEPELLQYIAKKNEEDPKDWCACTRPTSIAGTVMPAGSKKEGGIIYYMPPEGTSLSGPHPNGYMRRDYMVAFGYDPQCDLARPERPHRPPIHVGMKPKEEEKKGFVW